MFDNPATRPQLQALYNAEQSLLSFEGQQMQVGITLSSHSFGKGKVQPSGLTKHGSVLSCSRFIIKSQLLIPSAILYSGARWMIISDAGKRKNHGEVGFAHFSGKTFLQASQNVQSYVKIPSNQKCILCNRKLSRIFLASRNLTENRPLDHGGGLSTHVRWGDPHQRPWPA